MKTCPRCGAELSDEHTFCSVCGTVLPNTGVSDSASYVIDKMQREKDKRLRVILITLAITAIVIATGMFFVYRQNENVKSDYRRISAEIKDSNSIYISNALQTQVTELEEKAEPFFISSDLKQDVRVLRSKIDGYKILSELYDEFNASTDSELMDHIAAYRTKLDRIKSADVAATDEYKKVQTYIELAEARNKNKTWGENKIREFQSEHSDTISSWSRNHYITYYYGSAIMEEDNDYDFVLGVVDNDGTTHHAQFEYKFDGGSWDDGIKELYDYVASHDYCVIAVAATDDYGSYYDHVFIYNYQE